MFVIDVQIHSRLECFLLSSIIVRNRFPSYFELDHRSKRWPRRWTHWFGNGRSIGRIWFPFHSFKQRRTWTCFRWTRRRKGSWMETWFVLFDFSSSSSFFLHSFCSFFLSSFILFFLHSSSSFFIHLLLSFSPFACDCFSCGTFRFLSHLLSTWITCLPFLLSLLSLQGSLSLEVIRFPRSSLLILLSLLREENYFLQYSPWFDSFHLVQTWKSLNDSFLPPTRISFLPLSLSLSLCSNTKTLVRECSAEFNEED